MIDRLDSPEPVRTWVRLGTRVPLHASCSGRAVLSRLPDVEVDRLLTGSLERFSAQTITDRETLTAELREVRERGWAIADQSWRAGVEPSPPRWWTPSAARSAPSRSPCRSSGSGPGGRASWAGGGAASERVSAALR